MFNQKHAGPGAIGFTALLAILTACGTGSTPATAVSGTAVADGAIAGTVTLVDASSPAQERTVSTTSTGTFAFDTKGTQAPYLLKVAGSDRSGTVTLYGVSDGQQALDVNPLTDAAYAAAAGDKTCEQAFREGSSGDRTQTSSGTINLLNQLKTVLAPLLARYGIVDPFKDTAKVRLLLADVAFKTSGGTLTVTNRATGGVIYSAPLRTLTSGTFHPESMPAGPCATATSSGGEGATLYAASCQSCHGALASSRVKGATVGDIQAAIKEESKMKSLSGLTSAQLTAIASALAGATTTTTCGGTACDYTYGEWTPCDGGTQTRAVTSVTPAGCTGAPVVSQTCSTPPPPGACTAYTYSAWGACNNGTQARTVTTATPAGCTDQASAQLTSACTTTAPDGVALYGSTCATCHHALASTTISKPTSLANIRAAGMTKGLTDAQLTAVAAAINGTTVTPVACTSYVYSTWGACTNGLQTRTVLSASPTGCTNQSSASLSQTCSTAPTCTGYTYSAPTPTVCPASGQQSQSVTGYTPAGCTGTPSAASVPTITCTYVPTAPACTGYTYSAPTPAVCPASGQQTRTVTANTPAGCTGTPSAAPVLNVTCTPAAPACTGYTYSAPTPAVCPASGQQSQSVTGYTPAGCTGTPSAASVPTITCTYVPPAIDGAALFTSSCSGCHGVINKVATAGNRISLPTSSTAISNFGMTQGLNAAQVTAVAAAINAANGF